MCHLKQRQYVAFENKPYRYEHGAPTSHFQVGTPKVKRVDGDGAEPGGSCSPWHDESGSQPVPLPGTQTTTTSWVRDVVCVHIVKRQICNL